jgi:hypothetical protein
MILIATNAWAQESLKSEQQFKSYEGFKLIDQKVIKINKIN